MTLKEMHAIAIKLREENDKLKEDARVLAMYVRQYHEPDPQEYFYDDNLHTQICVCPACTLAQKYKIAPLVSIANRRDL